MTICLQVAIKFQEDINRSQSASIEINAHAWLSRATLDAIGEGEYSNPNHLRVDLHLT